MDANKLEKLREINFHVPKTCGLCVHSSFSSPTGEWGECLKATHAYDHQKHSNNPKALSIYRGGTCDSFIPDSVAMGKLGRFQEFVK